ncbi:TetR/AcrR family transcriptional regulator [Paracoccus halophilus]|nr:TetR/AcrR family transcriptional regulator [Paracoccus halophilus]
MVLLDIGFVNEKINHIQFSRTVAAGIPMARPRKEQELDIARRAVDETIRLLAERGGFDVPLTAVAQAVGCTAPALYGHFRNKNALLRAVREEGFGRLYNEKFAVFEQMRGDPLGYLRDGSYAYARFALDNPTLYRLMLSPPQTLGASDDPWSSKAGRQILCLLLTGLRLCQERGYLPGADLRRYGFMFWSTIHGAVNLNLQNRRLDLAAMWDSTQSVIDSLMEMIAATGPTELPNNS